MRPNPTFIETIRIQNGKVRNIHFHQNRFDNTRSVYFPSSKRINLRNRIDTNLCKSNLTKCRIVYHEEIISIEYQAYTTRPIASLQCIEIGDYDYSYKSEDRIFLSALFDQKPNEVDDILMIKDGRVTDTYYANVAFSTGSQWYTPKKPLLKGTMRAYLLRKGKLKEKHILQSDIVSYEYISIFNAMIPFGKIKISTSKIIG